MTTSPTVLTGAEVLAGKELEVVSDATVVIEDGKIASIEPGSGPVPEGAEVVDLSGQTLAPGFIDAHVHIGFHSPAEVVAGGVTTVRDLAWPPEEIHPLAARSADPSFDGPLIVAAGPMLTAPGGYPMRAEWAPPGTGRGVADPSEAAKAVALTAREGARVIKIALNPEAGPVLDSRTLKSIIDAAHDRGLKVTGHVSGVDQLNKAIEAGLDELAHMLMGEQRIPSSDIEEMVARGVVVVPTLSIRFGNDLRIAVDNLGEFLRQGGRVLYGTDLGNYGPRPGIDGREVKAMASAGMSPGAILESATVAAAEWLGLETKGVLAPGFDADIVGFRRSPLQNAADMTEVASVWRMGRRIGRIR
ncbi:MAG: amidohydrolase family protein [Actinomycetota bacterium]|nr:amidohydrolase family protein [Actinomycetota bacterium]